MDSPNAKGAPQPMAHAAAMSAALPVASCAPHQVLLIDSSFACMTSCTASPLI